MSRIAAALAAAAAAGFLLAGCHYTVPSTSVNCPSGTHAEKWGLNRYPACVSDTPKAATS